ncbi:MAG: NAD(P)/FAD-dependent oxidoreductase [Desulfomicrobiaceae bacterium]
MTQLHADMVILGAGPAGYAAALAASQRGKATVLVAAGPLGGTCLNWGCIPTKIYLGASEPLEGLRTMGRLRLVQGDAALDLTALRRRVQTIVQATHKAMTTALEGGKVQVIHGRGRITAPHTVTVPEKDISIQAPIILVATGSRPMPLPGVPFGGPILDSTEVLELSQAPQSLAIIGGGAIGVEMAQFWNRVGTAVTLVEAAPTLVPSEDPALGQALAAMLKRSGITVHTNAPVQEVLVDGANVHVRLPEATCTAQAVLVAIGRRPNTEDLGLEAAGAQVDGRGFVITDAQLRAAPGVYAIGDVNGRTLLAHAAEHQAHFAVAHALGATQGDYTPGPIPACVYGGAELVRVGPAYAELKTHDVLVSRAMLAANPMAQAHGHAHGMVQVYWRHGQVVGVAAVGARVSHLAGLAEAMVRGGWDESAAHTHIFAHPSLDEAVRAALTAPKEALP